MKPGFASVLLADFLQGLLFKNDSSLLEKKHRGAIIYLLLISDIDRSKYNAIKPMKLYSKSNQFITGLEVFSDRLNSKVKL